MKTDTYGQMIYNEDEVFNILMHDNGMQPGPFLVDNGQTIDVDKANSVAGYEALITHIDSDLSIEEFDKQNQEQWDMPKYYKDLDICKHVLDLCDNDAELQRCGEELLMFQERGLFNLLRYVKFLVDTMELNGVIWGVGRGSSVSSFVLFKLRIHRINSLYYDLDIKEFLR